jgi:adenosylcobinamide amidohydrolase
MEKKQNVVCHIRFTQWVMRFSPMRFVSKAVLPVLLSVSAAFAATPPSEEILTLPPRLEAEARLLRGERDGLWEKTLLVAFPQKRRTLSTFDGLVEAGAAINHSAHPRLWQRVVPTFTHGAARGGQAYIEHIRARVAARLGVETSQIVQMATAADLDNLAVVTKEYGPLTVTVLATAGARSNALRTGVDLGEHIEGENPNDTHGTINIMLLTNAQMTDGAMARAIVTVTEAKTAALQDLRVPSTYTPSAQATGTGTDSVIVVSGTDGPCATYTGGHSRLGGLIGEAAHQAVVEALGKQNGFFPPGARKFQGERHAAGKPAGAWRRLGGDAGTRRDRLQLFPAHRRRLDRAVPGCLDA